MSFRLPPTRPLHTWYVGARIAPATNCGLTEPRVPPTCRRPVRLTSLTDDTLGGRVQKMSDWTHGFRTTSHCEVELIPSIAGKSAAASESIRLWRSATIHKTRVARRIRGCSLHHDTMIPFGFRIQSPLPRWLASHSACQWFQHSH